MMSGVERAESSVWSIFRCSKDRLAPKDSRREFRILRRESGASPRISYAAKMPSNTQSFGASGVDMTPYNAISNRILLWKPEKTFRCRKILIATLRPNDSQAAQFRYDSGNKLLKYSPGAFRDSDLTPKHIILLLRSDNTSEDMRIPGEGGIVIVGKIWQRPKLGRDHH
jgi:hypothetical protein